MPAVTVVISLLNAVKGLKFSPYDETLEVTSMVPRP
jgi:hypothetical protein